MSRYITLETINTEYLLSTIYDKRVEEKKLRTKINANYKYKISSSNILKLGD